MTFLTNEHEHIWAAHPALRHVFMCVTCPAVARITPHQTTFFSADKALDARTSASQYANKVPETVREAKERS